MRPPRSPASRHLTAAAAALTLVGSLCSCGGDGDETLMFDARLACSEFLELDFETRRVLKDALLEGYDDYQGEFLTQYLDDECTVTPDGEIGAAIRRVADENGIEIPDPYDAAAISLPNDTASAEQGSDTTAAAQTGTVSPPPAVTSPPSTVTDSTVPPPTVVSPMDGPIVEYSMVDTPSGSKPPVTVRFDASTVDVTIIGPLDELHDGTLVPADGAEFFTVTIAGTSVWRTEFDVTVSAGDLSESLRVSPAAPQTLHLIVAADAPLTLTVDDPHPIGSNVADAQTVDVRTTLVTDAVAVYGRNREATPASTTTTCEHTELGNLHYGDDRCEYVIDVAGRLDYIVQRTVSEPLVARDRRHAILSVDVSAEPVDGLQLTVGIEALELTLPSGEVVTPLVDVDPETAERQWFYEVPADITSVTLSGRTPAGDYQHSGEFTITLSIPTDPRPA